MNKRFAGKKDSQMLLIPKDQVETFPKSVQHYVRKYFAEKVIEGKEYFFAFTCPQYEKGDKGSAPKSTGEMISEGGLSWLTSKLQESDQEQIIVFESKWFTS